MSVGLFESVVFGKSGQSTAGLGQFRGKIWVIIFQTCQRLAYKLFLDSRRYLDIL